jgi:hypothetical protein
MAGQMGANTMTGASRASDYTTGGAAASAAGSMGAANALASGFGGAGNAWMSNQYLSKLGPQSASAAPSGYNYTTPGTEFMGPPSSAAGAPDMQWYE